MAGTIGRDRTGRTRRGRRAGGVGIVRARGVCRREARHAGGEARAFFTLLLRTQRQVAFGSPDGFGAAGDDADAPPALDAKLVEEFLRDGLTRDTLGDSLPVERPLAAEALGGDLGRQLRSTRPRLARYRAADPTSARARSSAPRVPPSRRRCAPPPPAAALAATGPAGAAAAAAAALWAACARLKGSCAQLLEAPRDAMSRSLVWDRAFPIVRSGSGSGSGSVERSSAGPGSFRPRVTHGGWSDDGESETLVFHAGVGSSHVGMLRLLGGVPESALALEAPPGHVVVDAAAYTEGRCLVLLQPAGTGGGAAGGEGDQAASVVMADPRALAARGGGVGCDGGYALVDADALGASPVVSPGCAPARGC